MWGLVLKKIGLSFLTLFAFFVGAFGYGLVLLPFNLPYLLKISSDAEYYFMGIFALVFVCVATVMVRAKWCFENDLFFSKEDKKLCSLIGRVVASQEFIADIIVFVLWVSAITFPIGLEIILPWYVILLRFVVLVVVSTLLFAVLDCLLYVIARKKADKRLYKREDE